MPKRHGGETSLPERKKQREAPEQPHPEGLEQGEGKELATSSFHQDATRFGYLSDREGRGSSAEEFHDTSSQSEGEPLEDDINHIVTLHLREINDEQRAIYAEEYEIDIDELEEHWNSKHQKRVIYAKRYVEDVTLEDSPLEVLEKVNQARIWALADLYELDAKASIFDKVGEENYSSSEDEREREETTQQANTLSRSDILAPRNSTTWKQAQGYYESLRRRPNE